MKLRGRLHPALTWDATSHTFMREYLHFITHATITCIMRNLRSQYHVSIVNIVYTYDSVIK
jgi:hypothetical protein